MIEAASLRLFWRQKWGPCIGATSVAAFAAITPCTAADSPYHVHCDAQADIREYYAPDTADIYEYTAAAVRNFVYALMASGHYSNTDFSGASTMYVGIDLSDRSASVFFYGDNGCAFGYDDGWDADSVATQLSQLKLDLPASPTFAYGAKSTPK